MSNLDDSDDLNDDLFDEKKYSIGALIAVFLAVVGLIGACWYIYDSYKEKNENEMLLITAEQEDIKIQPLDPGGMVVDNMDKSVYDAIERKHQTESKVEVLLQPSEEPIDKKEIAIKEEATPVIPTAPAVIPVVPSQEEEIVALPVPVIKPEEAEQHAEVGVKAAEINQEEVIQQHPAQSTESLEAIKLPQEPPVVQLPQDPAKAKEEWTEEEEYIKPVAKKTPVKPKFANKNENVYKVQLASFKSNSDAEKEWKMLSRRHAALLKGYKHYIISKDIAGKGIFHRLQVGPFNSAEEAKNTCKQFKDVGMNCLIVKPSPK